MKLLSFKGILFSLLLLCVVALAILWFHGKNPALFYYRQGRTCLNQGDYDKAITAFNKAIQINPEDFYSLDGRAIAYFRQGHFDKAIADYSAAIKLSPDRKDFYYNRGIAYLNSQNFGKAINDFNQAIRFDSSDSHVYNSRGLAYCQIEDYDKAIEDYNRAIQINPYFDYSYFNRGFALYQKGNYDKAMDDFNAALRLNPSYDNAYDMRARCHRKRGEWLQSVADFKLSIQIDPQNDLALNNYAWLLATCPEDSIRDGHKAVELATKACELTKWSQWYCVGTLGASYAETGDFTNAIKYQEQALNMPGLSQEEFTKGKTLVDLYRAGKPYRE